MKAASSRHALTRDERGSIYVEYVVLLSCVAIGLAAAVAGLGEALFSTFAARETWLLLPFP